MTKSESLKDYFDTQRAHWADKLKKATLCCDQDTARMWVQHYDRMCAKFTVADSEAA